MKNLTREDFLSGKVDLHIHSNYSDGKADFKEIIDSAKDKGYKLISITDHNTVEGHKKYQDEILVTGAEFDCWFGYVFIHLLAYGIDVNHPALSPFLAKTKAETEGDIIRLFARRNVPKLIKAIESRDIPDINQDELQKVIKDLDRMNKKGKSRHAKRNF